MKKSREVSTSSFSEDSSVSNALDTFRETSISENDELSENLPNVASRETRQLGFVKVILIFVLLASTILISFAVYHITSTSEHEQFEIQFEDQATRLMQEFRLLLQNTIDALDNFSVTITSHVRSMNLEFPDAFVPEFDIRAASVNTLSLGKFLTFSVKVTGDNLENFENYTDHMSFWVVQSLARKYGHEVPPSPMVHNHRLLMETDMNMDSDMNMDGNHTDHSGHEGDDHSGGNDDHDIFTDDQKNYPELYPDINPELFHVSGTAKEGFLQMTEPRNMSLYYPVFQCEPVAPQLVNFNVLSHLLFGKEIQQSVDSNSIVVGQMVMPPEKLTIIEEEDDGHMDGGHMDNDDGHSHGDSHGHRRLDGPDDHDHSMHNYTDNTGHENHDVIGEFNDMTFNTDPYTAFIYRQHPDVGPFSQIVFPIFEDFTEQESAAGFLLTYVFWNDFIADNLPSSVEEGVCVIENKCGQQASFQINSNKKAIFLGEGDKHEKKYDGLGQEMTFLEMLLDGPTGTGTTFSGVSLDSEYCPYKIIVYPSSATENNYYSGKALTYCLLVIGTFVLTSLTFVGYDCLNEKRNRAVMENARQTNLIVSSLFPAIVRDRLFKNKDDGNEGQIIRGDSRRYIATPRNMLRSYLDDGQKKDISKSKPIADLFPDTTVLFADISGFTAWSSLREPSQVFNLLETIYGEFDALAKKRRVFKVETIGDCYVAVAGLPDPQDDHPVIMAKFADMALKKFRMTLKRLEITLGPDTTDLNLRLGLHSGPVTAGVLRGEKSRFQLFGDTVNTASRMESTSNPGEIQCSQVTADLLMESGYSDWLEPREEFVDVKGKGKVQTYWIDLKRSQGSVKEGSQIHLMIDDDLDHPKLLHHMKSHSLKDAENGLWGDVAHRETLLQNQRLIDWHVEMLSRLLKQIVAARNKKARYSNKSEISLSSRSLRRPNASSTPLSEVKEIIEMPKFDRAKAKSTFDAESVELSPEIMSQLRDYVSTLSCMYRDNPFHNFAHASHVTMASNKLLSRVTAPDDVYSNTTVTLAMNLHDYTYGLTSDPLTQFAIVFSALIHDVDHLGVSNYQLVKEKTTTASKYSGKSVAEQHSVDLAWEMLMDPSLEELRHCIYANETEYQRFRQLVVNCVIATDIFDKDLKELRNKRWELAFHHDGEEKVGMETMNEDFNRKATIVIEHIIQAADVSHTMQHWHVYQKWNERLFKEMYLAYKAGRGGDKDPTDGWYKGEIWFFDNYVIPLAQKLKECGVFGVSSAECLNYAVQNRQEWEKKGEDIVQKLKRKYTTKE